VGGRYYSRKEGVSKSANTSFCTGAAAQSTAANTQRRKANLNVSVLDKSFQHMQLESKLQKYKKDIETVPPKGLLKLDEKDLGKPSECAEYAEEVFTHLQSREKQNSNLPAAGYLKTQSDVTEKMRAILFDWMIDVHLKFKLLPETLFLTCNIVDRFLEKEKVHRQKLQLVGVTAMLIASKYEEIYAPEIRDFVRVTDRSCSKNEIKKMETKILQVLQFNLVVGSSFRFLERFAKLIEGNETGFNLARYLIEICLVDYKILKYSPSMIAASAIYLSQKMMKKKVIWNEVLTKQTGYTEAMLASCGKDICEALKQNEKGELQALKKKFALPKYNSVAKIKIEF
jgi:G2/mitotic-specific cyclin-B, other